MTRFQVVEASAGTGKTHFLEHRVIELLLETPATIDQILLVTFTEKATAELRARIRDKLAERSDVPKLRAALVGFDRCAISTIHGFCQRLLVEDAFSGRRLFDQTQVPDEAAFAEAFHLTLREQLAVDPALSRVLGAYLDAGHTVARLRDTLLSCARKGAPVTPELDPVALREAARRFEAAFGGLPALGLEASLGTTHTSTKTALAKKLVALREAVTGAGDDEIALASALSAREKTLAEIVTHIEEKVANPLKSGAELCAAALALIAAHVPIAAVAATRFLPHVVARVRTSKARRGQFDFQDMLRLVWETLEGERGAELAARLRKRHPYAMIDEFQDTDELQWKIFRRVWVEGDTTSLTIVGDPKQAIYSFRGADVHTYLAARAELEQRGGDIRPLADNYRSSAELVEAVNSLIDGTHGAFFTGGITAGAKVKAATQVGIRPAMPPVHVFEMEAAPGAKPDFPSMRATLAQRIAREVEDLLARGVEVLDRRGAPSPLRARDIHVLTRTGKESDEVAAALRARGVPCALYQREHLFSAAEALEVADLLAAIADPRERSARLRAWTTSFFAVPLAGLADVMEVPDGHPLLSLLHDWRGIALRQDWDTLFHRILEDTRWIERTVVSHGAGGGERAVTNVLHLFELLHDELARSPCEIHELEARLRGWIRTGQIDRPDDVDIQRLETDRQAVQIMTIHRAKGLEAAVVFVFGGTWPFQGQDDTSLYHDAAGVRRVHVGKHHGDTTERIDADTIEENQRLMYVAITRAKVRLYLATFAITIHEKAAIAPLHARVIGALAARATDPDSARLFSSERVEAGSLAPPPPVEAAEHLAGWAAPAFVEPPPDPAWAAIRAARGGLVVTSYSKLRHAAARASDRDDVRGEEHSASVALDDGALPGGASSGLFLHEVLEHVPFASARADADWQVWAARADVGPVLERAARRHGIADAHRARGAQMLHDALRAPVILAGETLPPLCDATRIAREVEFTYPLGPHTFARGYVDLLAGWDDRLWVIDYKSDAIDARNAAEARPHVERHYDQQSKLYGVAAGRLLALRDEADCRRRFGGVLYWFLRTNYQVLCPVSFADLARWTDELARAVAAAEAAP